MVSRGPEDAKNCKITFSLTLTLGPQKTYFPNEIQKNFNGKPSKHIPINGKYGVTRPIAYISSPDNHFRKSAGKTRSVFLRNFRDFFEIQPKRPILRLIRTKYKNKKPGGKICNSKNFSYRAKNRQKLTFLYHRWNFYDRQYRFIFAGCQLVLKRHFVTYKNRTCTPYRIRDMSIFRFSVEFAFFL